LESNATRAYSGTGLGLAVTKQLIDLHDSQILVTSEVGAGSTFTFCIAIVSDQTDCPSVNKSGQDPIEELEQLNNDLETDHLQRIILPSAENTISARKFRILLVDDDPVNLQVLNDYLSMQNYELFEADNGVSALELIKTSEPFDLVLLDIMMPKTTGFEVCHEIRQKYSMQELPIIFLTAKNQVEDLIHGFQLEANDFLSKPVSSHELITRVKTHLNLVDIHRHLEAKVAERTQQLEKVNKELNNANDALEQISLTDQLTGLHNRHFLSKYIDKDIVHVLRKHKYFNSRTNMPRLENSEHILYLVDLDHFKEVNDSYGHSAGDLVLQDIKLIIEKVFRESDHFIRWGGEEFLIISRFTDRNNAVVLAERLRHAFEGHEFDIGEGKILKKTCSIVFSVYPFKSTAPEIVDWTQVIDIADHCLYAAKNSSRNAWVGLESTYHCNDNEIMERINRNTAKLIEDNELCVQSSIGEYSAIIWENKL